ncbi:MAG: group II intron reverse transcriptase domain-containing protein [Bacteroidales bacterium]|nr:group II intron reverse transcriptase domain-containing protein [Bacteroidales bacterium]
MQSIIFQLDDQAVWEEFLAHRLVKGRFNWPMFSDADDWVGNERYITAVRAIIGGEGPGIPEKKQINKMGTGKKRTIYCFPPDETRVLKLMAFLLYRYDDRFSPNCYSFRRGIKASDAVFRLRKELRGKKMWAYKLDIHDYFNSIPIPRLLPILKDMLADDPPLYAFFERMLTDGRALADGKIIQENRGVMAGTPTSPFLADVYLMEVDRHFADAGVVYARYSDDIILFAPDKEELEAHKAVLLGYLKEYGLEVNPDKERIYPPDKPFEFLGFRCQGEAIDISEAVRSKMKGKIRRAARSLRRWSSINGIDAVKAAGALIRKFNAKLFEGEDPDSLSWSRWFFPVINRTEGLREIDRYLQQYIRFLSTGKHNKANYRLRYKDMKSLGYRSLVHEYYLYKGKN